MSLSQIIFLKTISKAFVKSIKITHKKFSFPFNFFQVIWRYKIWSIVLNVGQKPTWEKTLYNISYY